MKNKEIPHFRNSSKFHSEIPRNSGKIHTPNTHTHDAPTALTHTHTHDSPLFPICRDISIKSGKVGIYLRVQNLRFYDVIYICLTPLLSIFQLYRGSQFYWWRKPEGSYYSLILVGWFYGI